MVCTICRTEARVERAVNTAAGRYVEYACRNKRCEKHGTIIGTRGTAPAEIGTAPVVQSEGKEDEQE